jgi:plasmid replication initiation protein
MKNKKLIYKDNRLIQDAAFNLSLSEHRIILLCLAKCNSWEKILDNHEFVISVDDLHHELGISKSSAYQDLTVAVNKLWDSYIQLDTNNPESKMRWLSAKVHRTAKGEISLYFTSQILPFISELKNRFTRYDLKNVAKFKSAYSFRFYELMMSWHGKNQITVTVYWIREVFELGDKYPAIADLKKNVLLPALNDINNTSNLTVTFDQVKKGNVITHFIFKYSVKDFENVALKKITKPFILKHAKPGESWDEAEIRLSKQANP